MANDYKTQSTLLGLYADNSSGDISAQDFRDGVVSWQTMPSVVPVSEAHGGGTGTRADRATAVGNAITDATNNGLGYVLVTDPYLNYDASAVTFDNSVRMVREGQVGDVYDVKAYGAAVDGATVDTAAWQAAFDAASAGSTVRVPVGVSVIDATVSTDKPLTVEGSNREECIVFAESGFTTDAPVFRFNDGTTVVGDRIFGVTLRDFRVDGDSGNRTARFLELHHCPKSSTERITLTNVKSGTLLRESWFHRSVQCHATSVSGGDWHYKIQDNCQGFVCAYSEAGSFNTGFWVRPSADTDIRNLTFIQPNLEKNVDGILLDTPAGSGRIRGVTIINPRAEGVTNSAINAAPNGGGVHGLSILGGDLFGDNIVNYLIRIGGNSNGIRIIGVTGDRFTSALVRAPASIPGITVVDCTAENTGGTDRLTSGFAKSFEGENVYVAERTAFSGNIVFFSGNATDDAVAQQSALTVQDAAVVDATYGTAEEGVIKNNRTRIAELEAALSAYGLLP